MSKIFGIGLSKTGTCSLTKAMDMLGFRALHYPSPTMYYSKEYDFCCDLPICARYKELDKEYPDAKFILTIRDRDDWMKSIEKHFAITEFPGCEWGIDYRREMYGTTKFDPRIILETYVRHIEEVIDYFSNRPGKLLCMDICAGDGWKVLCPFVGKSFNQKEFPFLNKSI